MRFVTASGIVVGLASLVLGPATARAGSCGGEVECACGDTLRGATVLTTDLVGCGEDGLRLVDDAALDCAGHEISGRGDGEGVLLDEAEGAVVRDCRIVSFKTGVRLRGGSANAVEGSSIVGSTRYGIELARGSSANRLEGNVVVGSGDEGVHVGTGAHENEVLANEIHDSGAENLYVLASDRGRFVGNALSGSGKAALYVKHSSDNVFSANDVQDRPLHVRGASGRNLFEGNELRGSRFVFDAYKDKKHPAAVKGWTRPTDNQVVGGAVLETKTCFQFKGVTDNHATGVVTDGCRPIRESKKGGEKSERNSVSLTAPADDVG